jgi:hypothetical protein
MKKICLAIVLLYAPFAGAEYKCVDEKGLTHIGDVPPAGCNNVVMYEITSSGSIIRKIDPTPTAEQLKVRLEEAEKKKEVDRIAAEQKRKDMALTNTYSSEREFDMTRDRTIEPVRGRIASAKERMKAVEKREGELEDEMEFYQAGKRKTVKKGEEAKTREAPPQLVAELARIKAEKASLTNGIASHEKEVEEIRAKFDADKKRWVELKNPAMRTAQEVSPKAQIVETLVPGAAGIARCGQKVYECQAGQAYMCKESDGYRQRSYRVNCVVERK